MTLEAFQDSYTQSPMPRIEWPLNEPGAGVLDDKEDLHSILRMAQFDTNIDYQMEPYISYQMALSSHNLYTSLCESEERASKKQHLANTVGSANLYKKQVQTIVHDSLRKQRIDVNQEKQEIYHEFLLIQQQILHPAASNVGRFHLQMPKQQMKSCLQDEIFDGGLCSRRLKQYIYNLSKNKHENDISYWNKFVSEYYATGSKMRWCFSKYKNFELHTAGIFCPKSMETRCCQLCGLKSGQGLEATFEIFPRMFKIMSESGMLNEMLYLNSPRACKVSNGVILEYGKVIQENVYETFRVVHIGKLRIVFGHDLKITSWEFCIEDHDEYLQRTLFSSQINQLDKAVEKYQNIQNLKTPPRAILQDLSQVCNVFVSAGTQILENMELPLVNGLGYPKRFIRCLQMGEVVDNMRDLMTFSHNTKVGPIEGLKNYCQGFKTLNQMKGKRKILNEQLDHKFHANRSWMSGNSLGVNSSATRNVQMDNSLSSEQAGKSRDEALFDKLIREMIGSSSRGKTVQETYNEFVQRTSKELCYRESSVAASASLNLADPSTAPVILSNPSSHATAKILTPKTEVYSPDQLAEFSSRVL